MTITPWSYAQAGSEHAHQAALFMWAKMAERFGVTAANDPRAYESERYAQGICLMQRDALPQLHWLFAIPNGGDRPGPVAAKMKAEGAKRGVYDTFLPVPMIRPLWDMNATYHGLFLEMKKPTRRNHKEGGLSPEQELFRDAMKEAGYYCVECYTWQEAAKALCDYLGATNGGKGLS